MKQGQTYHQFNCPCGWCVIGETRHPDRDKVRCQTTFREHCQYPECDCDRPVTSEVINSTEFPRLKNIPEEIMDVLDGPEQECYPVCVKGMTKDTCPYNPRLGCDCKANPPNPNFYVTDPTHGGKVTCHKCNGFILEKDYEPYSEYPNKTKVLAHFHKDCYNGYEHYYGLDKPID